MIRWPQDQALLKRCYERDGYAVLPGLFDAGQVEQLLAQLDEYIAQVVPTLPRMDVFFEDKDVSREIKMLPRMHGHSPFFGKLLRSGRLIEIAASIWGCDAVPRDVAFFNKPARIGEATPPHQDGFYYHLEPCEALTFWIALDVVNQENGCVRYVPGSQHQGMRPHGRTEVLGFSQGITDFGQRPGDDQDVPVCVSPGDVIVHDAMTIHFADANRSSRPRRALGAVYFSSRARVDKIASEAYARELADELAAKGKI